MQKNKKCARKKRKINNENIYSITFIRMLQLNRKEAEEK